MPDDPYASIAVPTDDPYASIAAPVPGGAGGSWEPKASMFSLPAHGAGSLGPGQPEATPGMGTAGGMGLAIAAPMLTGGAGLATQAAVSGLSGAAQSKLMGGSNTEAGISGAIGGALPLVGPAFGKIAGTVTGRAAKAAGGDLFNTVAKAASDANLTVDANAAFDAAQKITANADQAGRNVLGIRKFMNRVTDPNKGPLTYEEARGFYQNIRNLSVSEQNALNPPTKRLVDGFLRELDTGIRGAADSIGQGENYSKAMQLYRTGAQRADFVSDKLTPFAKRNAERVLVGGAGGTAAALGLYDLLKSH